MLKTIELIYEQTHDGILPPSEALAAFSSELNDIIKPLKGRADFEALADICYDMAECGQRYGYTCGLKRGVDLMVECFT